MNAEQIKLLEFLKNKQQLIIPIYQRKYSWTRTQCEQLWNDVVKIAENNKIQEHFIGSIVCIEKKLHQSVDPIELFVIDGQQRLTTMSLLLAAFAKTLKEKELVGITSRQIENDYLFNNNTEKEDKRHKLVLTEKDNDTLVRLLEGRDILEKHSENIDINFKYFQKKINEMSITPDLLWDGITKLHMVSIILDRNHDKPQPIFESLNSTGLELLQADLIRNYTLMDLEQKKQEKIYKDYWQPMEEAFRDSKDMKSFDQFMKDYLSMKLGHTPNEKDVYSSFKDYHKNKNPSIDKLIENIHYFSQFYTKLIFEKEKDQELNQIICNINTLKVNVAYPFLLEVYADFDKGKILKNEIHEIFSMVESYVIRRSICGISSRSLNKIFVNLARRIDKENYLESIKVVFNLKKGRGKFPTDKEFKYKFIEKEIYHDRKFTKYFLDKLENYERKERVNVDEYTIEHIMPQNKNLSKDWREKLGPNWNEIQEKYVHVAGNLTLTGYNSKLGDKSFLEKQNMDGGFANSPIRLNTYLTKLITWNESEIRRRANVLSDKAIEIWKFPQISDNILANHTKDEEDDEDFEEDVPLSEWNIKLERASYEINHTVNSLIHKINEKFDCVSNPYLDCLGFYLKKSTERKKLFATVECSKNTANVAFRINPDSFKDIDGVRKVKGFFFPHGTERKISLTEESIPQIMQLLEQAYNITESLNKKID